MNPCKTRYIRIEDKDATERLDKLIKFLDENGFGFYALNERVEKEQKYVQIVVDMKITSNRSLHKNMMSIEHVSSLQKT